jgi:hypothetical protein
MEFLPDRLENFLYGPELSWLGKRRTTRQKVAMYPSITFSVAPLVYGVVAAVLVCVLVLAAFIAIDARKQQQREAARHPMQSRR